MREKITAIKKGGLKQALPYILLVGGIIGVLCSLTLSIEKVQLLRDPSTQPICNLNPVFSCTSVITSPEAEAFGFPNPYIGLVGFAIVATIGSAILAGARYKRWFWIGLQLGLLFALGFVHWLIFQALYDIGALCLFCMIVWSVTIPMFWYTLLYNLREKNIKTPKSLKSIVAFMQKHHADILIAWYMIIIALILKRFWYYWSTVL